MIGRSINIWRNIDWITIILVSMLVLMGLGNIYSVETTAESTAGFELASRYGKQFMWIILALVLAFTVVLVDTKFYMHFSNILYVFIILALLAVLIVGKEINGARSWFVIGGITLQPSEFAKFITALALARYLSTPNTPLNRPEVMLRSMFIMFLPAALILLQPDTGSTLVYAALFIVLFREGLPGLLVGIGLSLIFLFIFTLVLGKLKMVIIVSSLAILAYFILEPKKVLVLKGALVHLLISGLLKIIELLAPWELSYAILLSISAFFSGIIFLAIAYKEKLRNVTAIVFILLGALVFVHSVDHAFNNVLQEHHRKRINLVLGIESDPLGVGWNVNQSKIAIGSGGMWGKGYLRGTQTKYEFVPEQATDFIFCTIGEEWGFVGSIVLISLFTALLLRLIFLAERQKSKFSRVYGYSVFSIIFFHFAINIGMTIGLVPVIGIPLPFISYGGSSLWAFTILIFIFLKLDSLRTESL